VEKWWVTALFLNVLILEKEAKQRNLIVDIESGRTLFILNFTFLGFYLVLIVDECTLIWLHVRWVSTVHRTYTRTYRQEDNVILQDMIVVNKFYYV